MTELFEDSDYYTGPPLDGEMVRRAEADLGVRLPRGYVEALLPRNGGTPRRRCYPTSFPTSWADDHFEISAIRGIGGDWGIDSASDGGSPYLITEWGYPEIGVVVCHTPSGGHDTVMLDYSGCGPAGEPAIAYIDEDRVPRRIARSFGEFLARLTSRASAG
ncbi:SMI1/KNR4 family protein [Nocardiopsis akebiae]|uniref:SMI1/KNR4 family protein n=1 Tax=Nocardiopsis akebiae TaxID=2831968 RepID=A0ABX8C2V4_9ACTN|nr:SMI1/KNR4 family protein [Nocardiopsis akebiae]QUX27433.1 SMI1/KNR4 family protein [Nocardiopsis akebiae]